MTVIDPQEFGKLQAQVERLLEQDRAQMALLDKLFNRLDDIDKQLSEARGGWRMLMLIGGASAGVGATAASVLHKLNLGGLFS